ncbi:MAG: ATP synthase F0 subunit C [Actinomycetes bacterium]|jgi:F-type H+-transporting ATPase subunit c|nr:ATP synthase F0 subunit C [Actinomycetes bacterium]
MQAFAYPLSVLGAAFAISLLGQVAAKSIARQPEAGSTIQTVFILGAAFIEALTLLSFVLNLIG